MTCKVRFRYGLVFTVAAVALTTFACRPDFPECDTDEHCQEHYKELEEEGLERE